MALSLSASLKTSLLNCGTLISERLEAAPFQTFLLLASVWILSIPTLVFLMTRYWPSFNSKKAKPELRRSRENTDASETPAGTPIQTPSENKD
ncbi:hypothetical protein DTO013E5_622 [Penicillium roqueforti]|uniref:uncharacterized protein n=1 Tax=Penicillium roqueforti TaxID=5082 RepID=UPI00190D6A85|nr:uncharacterized protein LCP9604111_517 [Penicillium roqueforti]KAF9252991.1 hypothetical protein LCP9604111_517 [Penicillium roqueforti]KAI1838506.1 hypothetical protein CBS147337_231 [Penicillium roqueforti]KAI2680579.1 hypothetical protein CBS147355_3559 [Penicillium roqueforti]KAI2691032.1 hypothetical protein LCP963914a_1233 [Penicillium roqueforti]KAI2707000.1 hypothetical protein CBS147372_911 [Penicillium roqueforti]